MKKPGLEKRPITFRLHEHTIQNLKSIDGYSPLLDYIVASFIATNFKKHDNITINKEILKLLETTLEIKYGYDIENFKCVKCKKK